MNAGVSISSRPRLLQLGLPVFRPGVERYPVKGGGAIVVQLWPVGDGDARDFMIRFYRHWLGQVRSDPAAALQQTQRDHIEGQPPATAPPFILVDSGTP